MAPESVGLPHAPALILSVQHPSAQVITSAPLAYATPQVALPYGSLLPSGPVATTGALSRPSAAWADQVSKCTAPCQGIYV